MYLAAVETHNARMRMVIQYLQGPGLFYQALLEKMWNIMFFS